MGSATSAEALDYDVGDKLEALDAYGTWFAGAVVSRSDEGPGRLRRVTAGVKLTTSAQRRGDALRRAKETCDDASSSTAVPASAESAVEAGATAAVIREKPAARRKPGGPPRGLRCRGGRTRQHCYRRGRCRCQSRRRIRRRCCRRARCRSPYIQINDDDVDPSAVADASFCLRSGGGQQC